MNSRLKIIFLGTPNYLDPIIKSLEENFDLILTIRNPQQFNNLTIEQLSNLKPDLLVVASFGKIIPQEILEIPKLGAINIHPSKLPLYRGPSPIQSQILDGISGSAISFILMDSEMDHGPLIFQEPFEIKLTDTFASLLTSMFERSAQVLPGIINNLSENKITPTPQDESKASFCKEIKKEDGYFDIENPPNTETLGKMIRAYHPWPGCWTRWNNKIIKFLPNLSPLTSHFSPYLLQMEGKKAVPIKDFLNGYPNFPMKGL